MVVTGVAEQDEPPADPSERGSQRDKPVVDQPQRYPYQPALDGVRALAVIGVVLFHFDVGAAGGGFLGVDVFLVLSGFLITTLLLREHGSSGRIAIGAFYGRRARRLLPALLLVLAAVALYGHFAADALELVKLRADALASLFYVANWRFIVSGVGYFEAFARPSPVGHLWSLAIEEQWYFVWPLLTSGLLALFGAPIGRARTRWLAVTLGLATASAILMALLVDDSDVNRAYFGTDTRAQALLIGSAVAVACHGRVFSDAARRWLDRIGLLGLVAVATLFGLVGAADTWMYRGGFALTAVAASALIAAAATPDVGLTRRILSLPPFPELGRISYGVYLWHWPVVVLLDGPRTGLEGAPLFVLRLAVTLLVSIASYELVEQPIRHHRWPIGRSVAIAAGAIVTCAGLLAVAVPVRANPDQGPSRVAADGAGFGLAADESRTNQRILLVGDSVANGLGRSYREGVLGRPVVLRTLARLGCGLAASEDTECLRVVDQWRDAAEAFDPDVTIIVPGSWDLLPGLLPNRDAAGKPLQNRTKAYETYLLDRLQSAFDALTNDGGKVVLFTVPCYVYAKAKPPTAADTAWFNGVLRLAAAKSGGSVVVVEYGEYICPKGRNLVTMDGVEMRYDGVHLTLQGAQKVWQWLAPQLPSEPRQ